MAVAAPAPAAVVFLHSICVAQSVQGVLAVAVRGGHTGHHAGARFLAHKGVLQHLRQLAASEGRVAVLALQAADHLLEGQQGGVDLGALHARLLAVVRGVGAALAAGQVDEAQLAADLSLVPRLLRRHDVDVAASTQAIVGL